MKIVCLILLFACINFAIHASFNFSIGTGVVIKDNIRKNNNLNHRSSKIITIPIPVVSVRYNSFFFGGDGLGINLTNSPFFRSSIAISRSGDAYRSYEMKKRRSSFFITPAISSLFFKCSFMHDLENTSNGYKLNTSLNHRVLLKKETFITMGIGLEHFSSRYSNYYFGVLETESLEGRSSYTPKKATNRFVQLGLMSSYKKVMINISSSLKKYAATIKSSPTVRKDQEASLFLMTSVKF